MTQESKHEQVPNVVQEARQEVAITRRPWYSLSRTAKSLLSIYAVVLLLFAVLAWWVHAYPVDQPDLLITREFQENPAPWLHLLMVLISYPGSTPVLPALIVLAAAICWVLGLRLEAVVVVGLSTVSVILDVLIKLLVARPRPTTGLVEMFQRAMGTSFPSGHVMAYLAFWGLLFSLGVILFTGWRWWRILLLVVSACFVVLVGPSRIYLGDHWASDVLGSYLIGGVLLGMTLWIYLRLKRKGVLQTERARKITQRSRLIRSFPWK
jgi:membrane-associated phospholipid phosphatase